ncbi:MAG: sulfotransferase domain-containing protein [Myxococcota bacterium]
MTTVGVADDIEFRHDGHEYNDGALPTLDVRLSTRLRRYNDADRIVFLRRDPRDTMVSLFHQITGRFRDFFAYDGTISEFLRHPYFGAENLKRFLDLWQELESCLPVLRVRYEDCHQNFELVLKEVLDFFGMQVTREELAEASAAAQIEQMRAIEQSGSFSQPWLRPRNRAPKVRRGKVGGFRDELELEDIDYLNKVFEHQIDFPEL